MLLFQHQLIEDRQYLFSIAVHAAERIAKAFLIAAGLQPLVQQGPGNVNIAAEVIGRVAAQEKAVEDSRFPLRTKRVEIFTPHHTRVVLKSVSYYREWHLRKLLSHQSNNAVKPLKGDKRTAYGPDLSGDGTRIY